MKTLVTGGLGFIGRHLLSHLEGEVIVVDDLSNSSISVNEAKELYGCKIHEQRFSEFNPDDDYDFIYHLGSPVGPAGVLKYAGEMSEIMINDAVKVLKLAEKTKAGLMLVSSSEVYGKNPQNDSQKENQEKIIPEEYTVRLEYGVSKLLMEITALSYARVHDVNFNIIRPYNIIGPAQSFDAGFVIPRFMLQLQRGEVLTVFGDGEQVRCFTYVDDIIDAMKRCMDYDVNHEIFNIGNPDNRISIKGLAKKVIERFGNENDRYELFDPKVIYGKHYEEAWNKIPDISKARTLLDWEPKWDLDSALDEIWKFGID